jgi:plastocyanin
MTNLKAAYCFACSGLAFAALLAGCFSERVAGSNSAQGAELCAGTQPNVVRIRNFSFNPAQITVPPGTRVTFVNCDDGIQHTSTADAGAWDSGLLSPNATFDRVFDQAGTFAYHCEPHPGMKASVVVQ